MLRHLSLSARLTLALAASTFALVGAGGVWQVTAEEADLRRAVDREQRLLGRSLQVAFENALRDRQAEDVEETLHALSRIDPSVDILVYDRTGRRIAASAGAVGPDAIPPRAATGSDLRFVEDGEEPRVELRLPLEIGPNIPPATMLLVRPLREMQSDLEATRQRVVLSTAAFVLVVLLMTIALTQFWVARPLRRMIEHMRRVRAGDLSPSRAAHRRDEIGATLHEFDALVTDLALARERLEDEEEARRSLERALREVDKLATVGQLAAGLAHEIGSPLQILDGRIASLQRRADDPEETRRVAAILREQSQRITRIVERMLAVVRRPPVTLERVDPVPPVRAVVELLEGEARRRGIALSLEAVDELPPLRGDADSVQQIALNLVRNALQATPPGGAVAVSLGPGELRRADGPIAVVRLQVRDTGRGLDEAQRAQVFDPFFTTRAPEGTGLGLTVVKAIVDELGGRISLDSAPGTGACFTVEIPCPDPSDEEEDARGRR